MLIFKVRVLYLTAGWFKIFGHANQNIIVISLYSLQYPSGPVAIYYISFPVVPIWY